MISMFLSLIFPFKMFSNLQVTLRISQHSFMSTPELRQKSLFFAASRATSFPAYNRSTDSQTVQIWSSLIIGKMRTCQISNCLRSMASFGREPSLWLTMWSCPVLQTTWNTSRSLIATQQSLNGARSNIVKLSTMLSLFQKQSTEIKLYWRGAIPLETVIMG